MPKIPSSGHSVSGHSVSGRSVLNNPYERPAHARTPPNAPRIKRSRKTFFALNELGAIMTLEMVFDAMEVDQIVPVEQDDLSGLFGAMDLRSPPRAHIHSPQTPVQDMNVSAEIPGAPVRNNAINNQRFGGNTSRSLDF